MARLSGLVALAMALALCLSTIPKASLAQSKSFVSSLVGQSCNKSDEYVDLWGHTIYHPGMRV